MTSPGAGTLGLGAAPGSRVVPIMLAFAGWAVLALTAAHHVPVTLRAVVVFLFALTVPGAALVRLLPVRDLPVKAVLAVAISMSVSSLAAEGAAIGHTMHAAVVLAVLASICSAAGLAELTRTERARLRLARTPPARGSPS